MNYTYFVVAIGLSAGGLDPLRTLVSQLPPTKKASFVVVQHLHPEYQSKLKQILSRVTNLQVVRVERDCEIEPGKIYVLAESRMMTIENGILKLRKRRSDEKVNLAVDIFLKSLSADAGNKAIAVILSGANHDGSEGVKCISEAGGTVIVQEPSSAQFQTMPAMAIKKDSPEAIEEPGRLAMELMKAIE